jgi:hypothetical protein
MSDGQAAPLSGKAVLGKDCPLCGAAPVALSWGLVAKPLGTYSLSGAQIKASATVRAVVFCQACPWEVHGRMDGATMDGGTFTGGHFVADGTVKGDEP